MQKYPPTYRTNRLFALIICYSVLAFLTSCDSSKTKEKLDVDNIDLNYRSVRFDKEFSNIDTNYIMAGLDAVGTKHPDFTNFISDKIGQLW